MKKLFEDELVKMNMEYVKMFSSKLEMGIYIYDNKYQPSLYELRLKKLGFQNVKTIKSINDVDTKTIKNASLVVIGLKDRDYIDYIIKFINLGMLWENTFAKKDIDYFIKCVTNKGAKIDDLDYFISINDAIIKENYNKLKENETLIAEIYNKLFEDDSKKVFLRTILKTLVDCPSYLDIYSPNQYLCDFVPFGDDEIIVDAGAYDGDTIKQFAEKNPNFTYIYAFEPDSEIFFKLVENTKHYNNIDYFSVGLSDKSGNYKFCVLEYGASTFCNSHNQQNTNKLAIPGDLLEIKPTFIKMDIEGFELNALKGFQNTIKRFTPKLAICVYHKFEDIFEIPLFINSINPSYKLYLRHHSFNSSETVLYAIP